jgi:hypothetical protein
MIVSSFLAGLLVTKTGRYKPIMIGGSVILLIGAALLTGISLDSTLFGLGWRMVIIGVGLGPAQSLFTLAVQNSVPFAAMGVATRASQFFRQIGSVIGLAIFGTLLTIGVQREVPKYVPTIAGVSQEFDLNSLGVAGEASAGAPSGLQSELTAAFGAVLEQVAATVAGDQAAALALASNPDLPEAVRAFGEQAPSLTQAERESQAPAVLSEVQSYVQGLGEQFQHGIKLGFAVAIRLLFQVSFVILLLGSAVIPFIPGLPLRKVAAIDAARSGAHTD